MKPANNIDPLESTLNSYSLETIDDAIHADELLQVAKRERNSNV